MAGPVQPAFADVAANPYAKVVRCVRRACVRLRMRRVDGRRVIQALSPASPPRGEGLFSSAWTLRACVLVSECNHVGAAAGSAPGGDRRGGASILWVYRE